MVKSHKSLIGRKSRVKKRDGEMWPENIERQTGLCQKVRIKKGTKFYFISVPDLPGFKKPGRSTPAKTKQTWQQGKRPTLLTQPRLRPGKRKRLTNLPALLPSATLPAHCDRGTSKTRPCLLPGSFRLFSRSAKTIRRPRGRALFLW